MESQVSSFPKQNQINIVLNDQREKKEADNERAFNPFEPVDQAMADFVGMAELKENVKEIYANVQINQHRQELGLKTEKQVLHMMFKGNPGTGKTTVARKLATLFYELNMLSKGHFIEAERADIVGEYIGHTAKKTRSLVEKALGGILFIDEAYALARGGEKDFGKEAIDTLVKQMEDHHDDFILILAGYPMEMDYFLSMNPGLASRFPIVLDFDDYSIDELIKIAHKMTKERDYHLSKEAEWKLKSYLSKTKQSNYQENFANARLIRNIIEQAIRKHAIRLIKKEHYTVNELMLLTSNDIIIE
ncbi:stage V sporulation protein K [Paraliobacillus quinghaiensis]|uniref:Stage V sporulation protein K n=1 Tax=Paraliobacillus quinghaiensis TaxID=470815 RepID=A0A917TG90_9BACI|nr:stage V sporulation protein K [Paraliobacillus quinghaiensis]